MNATRPDVTRGAEVPFDKISEAMARRVCQDAGATPMRALVATVVAIGSEERLDVAAEALRALADAGTVRGMLISEGTNPSPPAQVIGNTVALHALKSSYINNAVAALRLSSLPTLVWWRGGAPETLDGLARLADRVVLDEEDPTAGWARAVTLFEESAFSDLRWARLTQWRGLMAHFFDIPEVQKASPHFASLHIRARDRASALLFAAWLTSSIEFNEGLAVEIADGSTDSPVEEVRLGDDTQTLVVSFAGAGGCLETALFVGGHRSASRVVPLGDQSLNRVLADELRLRARDMAFERTVHALVNGPVAGDHTRGSR